jgi:hypothetical protein
LQEAIMIKHMLMGAAIVVTLTGPAAADDTEQGKQMVAAFTCSKFAYLAGKPDEQVRLLHFGLETGRRVIDAEVALGKWPALFKGVSTDFLVGLTYSDVIGRADDRVRKTALSGRPLKPSEWISDPKQLQEHAAAYYDQDNCAQIGASAKAH